MIKILHEKPEDFQSINHINLLAFETEAEANLVDKLRGNLNPFLSLVAKEDGIVLGHILFTPVTVCNSEIKAMGLGPMAVSPVRQGQGIGSSLVKEGLKACLEIGIKAVFVLGESDFYKRFGFELALSKGIYYKSEQFAPYFFLIELVPGILEGISGEVLYHKFFNEL